MNQHEGSWATGKEPCPKCRANGGDTSGNNLVKYSDGHGYCFACSTYFKSDGSEPVKRQLKDAPANFTPKRGVIQAIDERGLTEETCQKFNYQVVPLKDGSGEAHVANFYKDGTLQAQHIRLPGKKFAWLGNTQGVTLFGQHLWKSGGNKLIITEGEIDAMSISQVQDNKWPVVSLPMGAAGAVKAIKANYEFVSSYKEVVLVFDNDDAGHKAAKEVADILPPGKVKIVTLSRKDANEHLVAGDTQALITSLWNGVSYRPDGILHASEVGMSDDTEQDIMEYPWDPLTEKLCGQRSGEMVMWTSGTGSGKSTITRALVADHLSTGKVVGVIMLEESPKETVDDLVSVLLGKPVRKIKALRKLNALRAKMNKPPVVSNVVDDLTDEEYNAARNKLNLSNLYIYDHHGSSDYDNITKRIEYMVVSLGCEVIILDHVTAAVAGMMGQDEGDSERLLIDRFMNDMRNLIERTGTLLHIISQLKKSNGKGWEEGEQITLQALRGSGSLGTVPNTIIAMERNRQDPDPIRANISVLRVLKDRFTGFAGVAAALLFDQSTNHLRAVPFTQQPDGTVMFTEVEGVPNGSTSEETPNVFADENADEDELETAKAG